MSEIARVKEAYARRAERGMHLRYDPLTSVNCMMEQEFERCLIRLIWHCGLRPVENKYILDVGCGNGRMLLQLMRYGFDPAKMTAIELLHDRYGAAARRLPHSVKLFEGDVLQQHFDSSFDMVIVLTVFSSILNQDLRMRLARHLWSLCKPQGGGVLLYDFTVDNPRNADVRGVPMREIRDLFPAGEITSWRVTLAPPIARVVTRLHPALYTVANLAPVLRSHVLCWIQK